jgi:hypothetical protein
MQSAFAVSIIFIICCKTWCAFANTREGKNNNQNRSDAPLNGSFAETLQSVAVLGVHNYSDITTNSSERYEISPTQKVLYPFYNSTTQDGDFLLLFLDRPSKFQPVKLNINANVPISDEQLTVMGWGMQETGTFSQPKKLLWKKDLTFGVSWRTRLFQTCQKRLLET